MLAPTGLLTAWDLLMVFRGNGEMAANVLVALPVSNICDKSFWILGIKMEPGSPQRNIGKGRRPWVVTWETLVGCKEKLLPQERVQRWDRVWRGSGTSILRTGRGPE